MTRYKFLLFVCLFSLMSGNAQELDSLLKPLKYRSIGPFRGGRANAGTGILTDPMTYYMGTTGGGVWKTTDAGQHWNNISDGYFKTGSVGAIAVADSNSEVVYVGMGEHAPRGVMTSHGDGVYKSIDAGLTWSHMGLAKTQHISRIVVHPSDPNTVWVAAQGALHGPSEERGVYKSIDGGASWKQVLYNNEYAGASEISIDRNNPQILYAALWEHTRKPWQVVSGGPGSGLYKSEDGGETWSELTQGLPEEKGKMAISVSPVDSNLIFALVEGDSSKELGGLFKSDDAGMTWVKVSGDHRLIQRAWYYIEIALDPLNEDVLYVLSASTYRSEDGGSTWEEVDSNHGDYHDLWINPKNSENMILTSDGGSEVSFDYGESWSRIDHMPTAQFYRINTDNLFPYNIYGGQQDNSSVKIASIGLGSSGIDNTNWSASAGGESAFLAFDPDQPDEVMGGSYLGTIELLNTKSRMSTQIMIEPNLYLGLAARDMKYLYNWNAPIRKSAHEEDTYYHGAQYVLRTRDKGMSWEVISPDLTTNDDSKQGKGGGPLTNEAVGAENYGTLSDIVESPHESGVIYTGSDDGMVYVTKDNGKTWKNITPKKLPETLINSIEVSPHDPATVYIATTRYKFNDFSPAIYKSSNYGKTWKNISSDLPMGQYTRVIREDSKRKDLLFAGTFSGVYCSFDGGSHWSKLTLNLPNTPITDLKVAHDNLIVATQGRSFWILDDLDFLREYPFQKGDFLFVKEHSILANWYSQMNASNPSGVQAFSGVNPASGLVMYYNLSEVKEDSKLKINIYNSRNELVNSFSSSVDSTYISYEGAPGRDPRLSMQKGLNRFVWDMNHFSLPGIPKAYIEGSFSGHKAIPGKYRIELDFDGLARSQYAYIDYNPMYNMTEEDYRSFESFMQSAESTYTEMTDMVNSLYQKQLKLKERQSNGDNSLELTTILNKFEEWDGKMVQRLSQAYDDVENYENGFTAFYITLINQVNSGLPRVSSGANSQKEVLDLAWEILKEEASVLLSFPEN